jgi:V/A-type H+-transporting ATPase subunit I
MSIVQLDRMTLYGPASQQARIIDRLQHLGCAHLIDLNESDREAEAQPENAAATRRALKYLESCPQQRRQFRREQFECEVIVTETLEVQRKERELEDEHDSLEKAIRDLKPWGEFRLPSDVEVNFWFYVVPIRDVAKLSETDLVWQEATRDHRFAYVVVLSESEPEDAAGTSIELDPRPLSELQDRLNTVEEQLDELHLRREGLTRWCDLIRHDLNRADDKAAREHAEQLVLNQDRVLALQGWVPRNQREQLEHFATANDLAITIERPAAGEDPPTLLDNPEPVAGGEYCVTFYKTPSYWTWDPSIIVFFSFAIFFAMILADAGYALLLGLLLAWKWKKMGATAGARKGRNLILALVVFSFIYGVLACSYFGASPPGLDKLKVLDVQNQAVMMPLAIAIGILHISLANFITAWRLRGRAQAFSALGWIAVMVGGLIAGLGSMATSDEELGQLLISAGTVVLVAGFLAVFLFTSERPLLSTSIKNHLLRVIDGFKGLTRLSSLFGDVLSYLRLFALGLSSAQLAATFNELGGAAWDSAGFGVLMAILIIFVGHSLNLLLGLMSGVVHGLRLNCIEFFNWSLPDEGRLFKAFTKKARQP